MTRREEEKKVNEQIVKLFGGVMVGLCIIFAIQVIGRLITEILRNNAGWEVWTLSLVAEALIIGSILSPALWHHKAISTKQHNAWTVINFSGWLLWIVAAGAWTYFSTA